MARPAGNVGLNMALIFLFLLSSVFVLYPFIGVLDLGVDSTHVVVYLGEHRTMVLPHSAYGLGLHFRRYIIS